MIALIVFTDGRHTLLQQTLRSAFIQLKGPITRRVIFDDTARAEYGKFLREYYGPAGFDVVSWPEKRGFGGTIRSAWEHVRANMSEPFIFHLEDDFTFNEALQLEQLALTLDERPHLQQMALRRQAWNRAEVEAGGVVELNPGAYEEVGAADGRAWLEHRLFFTTNPSLYRRALVEQMEWPAGAQSEGRFTFQVLEACGPEARFGYWGKRTQPPLVSHIGEIRNGHTY